MVMMGKPSAGSQKARKEKRDKAKPSSKVHVSPVKAKESSSSDRESLPKYFRVLTLGCSNNEKKVLPIGAPKEESKSLYDKFKSWYDIFFKYQDQVYRVYSDDNFQIFVASLIVANFISNIIGAQIDPFGAHHADTFMMLEDIFNIIFLLELLMNMYGSWCCKFWRSSWNVFDFVVVVVGMLSIGRVDLPGPLGLLRMLRAFRVFRLFKRIKSLNKIIVALINSLPGVANAFIVLTLFMCIYAILAVDFFGKYGKPCGETIEGACTLKNDDDDPNDTSTYYETSAGRIDSQTPRKYIYGDEYFGNFARSMYTLFQVLTGESWSEVVARPLLFGVETNSFGVAIYFVTFILLCSIILINVVVAVLLDKFVTDEDEDEEGSEEEEEDTFIIEEEQDVVIKKRNPSSIPDTCQKPLLSQRDTPKESACPEPALGKVEEYPFARSLPPSGVKNTPCNAKKEDKNVHDEVMAIQAKAIHAEMSHISMNLKSICRLHEDVLEVRRDLSETRQSLSKFNCELEGIRKSLAKVFGTGT